MEERHARKKAEIELELVAICMKRLGEDMAGEAGPLGVEKQGDDLGCGDPDS